jgi:hypothetical protein
VSRAVLVGVPVVWAALMVSSLRKCWRTSDDPRKAGIYRGREFWCVFATVCMAVAEPKVVALPGIPYDLQPALIALVAFPVIANQMIH